VIEYDVLLCGQVCLVIEYGVLLCGQVCLVIEYDVLLCGQVCQHPHSALRTGAADALTTLVKSTLSFEHDPPVQSQPVSYSAIVIFSVLVFIFIKMYMSWCLAISYPLRSTIGMQQYECIAQCETSSLQKDRFWAVLLAS